MTTIPPFDWPVPEDTDLLADGAATIRALAAAIAADLARVGEVRMWAAESAVPPHWLVCDARPIPTQYAALIAAIGPTTPDLTDRVPMGGGTALEQGGANERTLLAANLPPHVHSIAHGHTASANNNTTTHTHVTNHGHTIRVRHGIPTNLDVPQTNAVTAGGGSFPLDTGNTAVQAWAGSSGSASTAHGHVVTVGASSVADSGTGTGLDSAPLDTTPANTRLVFAVYGGAPTP